MTRLLHTFSAACDVVDTTAARNPKSSNVGLFHDAAPIPAAMGSKDRSVAAEGRAAIPSNNSVKRTVIRGMPHLEVYVRDIPMRSNAMELV